jgi:hypothetical protein
MKLIGKLFGGADGGDSALDVMVGDAEEIPGFFFMPTLTHAGVCSFALEGAILSFRFKGIVARSARFRPPLFALEKNGIVLGAFGFHHNFSGLIFRVFGAGHSLDRDFLELPGSVGINSFSAATINIHEDEQSQDQNGSNTGCGYFHRVSPRWIKSVYI